MKYTLLERPGGHHFYTSRRRKVKAIVVHCTAGLEDMVGADNSAEATARYASTTDRKASWHSGSDADSFVKLLPASYTAWHCINYNSSTYGHEISKRDMTWADEPAEWVERTLTVAARGLAPIAASLGVPIRRCTKAELDRAIATDGPPVGFIAHMTLDPRRRRDPGKDFPWQRFLGLMRPPAPKPAPKPAAKAPATVKELLAMKLTDKIRIPDHYQSDAATNGTHELTVEACLRLTLEWAHIAAFGKASEEA